MSDPIQMLCERARKFHEEAHSILAKFELAQSRIISLEDTRQRITTLSCYQKDLFDEAVACIEQRCFRAAHVMAWAAFMDYLEKKMGSYGLQRISEKKTGWSKFKNIDELREHVAEHQLIMAAKDIGLLSKNVMKTLHGLLAKRNECAHPSKHTPNMNEAIGYVSELLGRIELLEKKSI